MSVFPKPTGAEAGGSRHTSLPCARPLPSYRCVHLCTSNSVRAAGPGQSPRLGTPTSARERGHARGMLGRAAQAADGLSLRLQLIQQLQLCILVFILCLSDGSSNPSALLAPQPSSSTQQKPCCVLENRSPSEMAGLDPPVAENFSSGPANTKKSQRAPGADIVKRSVCLSAWLGWVSAQHLAGSSHYLCCNAPVPAGSGGGSLAGCPEHQPELPA